MASALYKIQQFNFSLICATKLLQWMYCYRLGMHWDCAVLWRFSKEKFSPELLWVFFPYTTTFPATVATTKATATDYLVQHRHSVKFITTNIQHRHEQGPEWRISYQHLKQKLPSVSLTSEQCLKGNGKYERNQKTIRSYVQEPKKYSLLPKNLQQRMTSVFFAA